MDARDIELVNGIAKVTFTYPRTDETAIAYAIRMITELKKENTGLKKENEVISELQNKLEIIKQTENRLKLEIESIKEKHKNVVEDKEKQYENFYKHNFVTESSAGPLTRIEIQSIYRDFKRSDNSFRLKFAELYDMMKLKCGNGSTDRHIWGVRISEEYDMP